MSNIQDYFVSTKPAKLMLTDGDGKETGDYLGVISLDAAKVSRLKARWHSDTAKIIAELKGIESRCVDGDTAIDDIHRKSEIHGFELKEIDVEFAMHLLNGSSFSDLDDDSIRELLSNVIGDGVIIANAVIALANDEDRLKQVK